MRTVLALLLSLPSISFAATDFCIRDVECLKLAEAIYYEARGEPELGQLAVAHVILNRKRSKYFPKTIAGVVHQKWQFSYTFDGSMKKRIDPKSWNRSVRLARKVLYGRTVDPTGGSNHFWNPTLVPDVPAWTSAYEQVIEIGNHIFHKR